MIKLAKVLYGSQNYGTSTETSDKDYKLLVLPQGRELFSNSYLTGGTEHETLFDFRSFVNGLAEGKLNSLELMVSQEVEFYDEDFKKFYDLMSGDITECFAAWNQNSVLNSLKGIAHSFFTPIRRKAGPYEEVPSSKNVARGFFFSCLYYKFGFAGDHFTKAWATSREKSLLNKVRESENYLSFLEAGEALLSESGRETSSKTDMPYGKEMFLEQVLYPQALKVLNKNKE